MQENLMMMMLIDEGLFNAIEQKMQQVFAEMKRVPQLTEAEAEICNYYLDALIKRNDTFLRNASYPLLRAVQSLLQAQQDLTLETLAMKVIEQSQCGCPARWGATYPGAIQIANKKSNLAQPSLKVKTKRGKLINTTTTLRVRNPMMRVGKKMWKPGQKTRQKTQQKTQ